jgi:hypothetical protein
MSNPDNLRTLIDAAIHKKQGNKEFALFYDVPDWYAEIGNPSRHVNLGESVGEFQGKGDTPENAVKRLLELLP